MGHRFERSYGICTYNNTCRISLYLRCIKLALDLINDLINVARHDPNRRSRDGVFQVRCCDLDASRGCQMLHVIERLV